MCSFFQQINSTYMAMNANKLSWLSCCLDLFQCQNIYMKRLQNNDTTILNLVLYFNIFNRNAYKKISIIVFSWKKKQISNCISTNLIFYIFVIFHLFYFFVEMFGTRHFVTFMLFLGMANAYVMRTNMSVAIVAMVDHKFNEAGRKEIFDDECPNYINTTTSVSSIFMSHK